VAQPRRRDRHVGGTAAEVLAEGVHVLQADADLVRVDIDPAAADGHHLEGVLHGRPPSFHRVVWAAFRPALRVLQTVLHDTGQCQYFVLTSVHM
jgi:hypothetical protein